MVNFLIISWIFIVLMIGLWWSLSRRSSVLPPRRSLRCAPRSSPWTPSWCRCSGVSCPWTWGTCDSRLQDSQSPGRSWCPVSSCRWRGSPWLRSWLYPPEFSPQSWSPSTVCWTKMLLKIKQSIRDLVCQYWALSICAALSSKPSRSLLHALLTNYWRKYLILIFFK